MSKLSDELKQALERLRKWNALPDRCPKQDRYAIYPGTAIDRLLEVNMAHQRDMRLAVAAYLAEMDPTPITPEWLESLGFKNYGTCTWRKKSAAAGPVFGVTVDPMRGCDGFGIEQEVASRVYHVQINEQPTRGAMLKLLSALGVPTKE